MLEYRTKNGVLIKLWVHSLDEVESQAMEQLNEMARLPFLFDHIAVMPDVHLGKGAVVGSVVAARDAVVPNIVGVDIGCGISAYRTNLSYPDVEASALERGWSLKEFWKRWENRVERDVPTGFFQHKQPKEWEGLDVILRAKPLQHFIEDRAPYQLGTLGGGNHFIEAQVDEEERIWFMVHSGSRHTGLQIAEYYNRQAETLLNRTKTPFPPNLAYLPKDDDLYHDYMHDMEWAIAFALENRWQMLERAVLQFLATLDESRTPSLHEVRRNVRSEGVNIHHNFARVETHYGRQVVVHRKGATSANSGEIGIVPGSMATGSFIVRGKGNPESFRSCSHGAGRVMSRRAARKTLTQKEFERALANTFTKPSANYIDEAPQTYKNVEEVLAEQADLVEVLHRLRPIITIKGDSKASVD